MSGNPPPVGFAPFGQPGAPGSAYGSAGYPTNDMNSAFPQAHGYGAPPASSAYGQAPTSAYGVPPVAGHGAPPTSGYGAPPTGGYAPQEPGGYGPPASGGYGPPGAGSYGAPPAAGYGAPPSGGYGAPPSGGNGAPVGGSYGAPAAGGYGAPAPGGYGAPAPGGYGTPAPGGYGAPAPGGYGAPAPGGYGAPPAPGYGSPASGYGPPSAPGYGGPPSQGYGAAPVPDGSAQKLTCSGVLPSAVYGTPTPGYAAPEHGYAVPPQGSHEFIVAGRPTVKPVVNFNAGNDAEELRQAMRGMGTDEKRIIAVLSKRSAAQRKQIADKYKASFGKSLEKCLKSELSGHFEDVILASILDTAELQAKSCFESMEGLGTKEMTLIQVVVPSTNFELKAIKEAYQRMYGRTLEKDVVGDTSGDFEKVLVAMLQCCREEGKPVDARQAEADADALYQSGENRLGTEEATFTRLLSQRSFPHIKEVASFYLRKYRKTLIKAIEKETSGYYEKTLVAIVKFAENKNDLFATWIYESMAGMGTRDKDLIRLVLTRSELDLEDIKDAYSRLFKKTMSKAIEGDTSGDYKRFLVSIVDGK